MTRPKANPEPGDWIIYIATARSKITSRALGGPWVHGKLVREVIGGWEVAPAGGSPLQLVLTDRIARVTLTRGEAIVTLERLAKLQFDYIAERDALEPKFLQRVADVLANA